MKGRGRKRLLAGALCMAMLFADADLMSLRVVASEAGEENSALGDVDNAAINTGDNVGEGEKKEEASSELKDDGGQSDSVKKDTNTEDGDSQAIGEEESESGESPTEGSNNGNDENERNGGAGSESEVVEGTDEEQGENGTENGESAPEETGNVGGESGEGTDAEENGEDTAEGTVSENTVAISEEVMEDAETATKERAVTASGKCGDNLTWTLEDGTLTISGTGEMYDYGWQGTYKEHIDAPWIKYRDEMKSLVIEDGLTSIGISAFEQCTGLAGDLVIPNSVKKVGEQAFYMCSGFTGRLIIPENVTEIGTWAFMDCSGFTGSLVIPDSVTKVGFSAFDSCEGFSGDLIIGSGLTKIENSAFGNCCGFKGSLFISDGITEIGEHAFEDCSGFTSNLLIPSSVTKIGQYAFSDCSGFTGNLTIGDSVTEIGWHAFENCCGFVGDLIIPDSVIEIGSYAFKDCAGFTGNLIIGNGVKKIEDQTFQDCDGFTGNLTIGNNVTVIEQMAFSGCSNFAGNLIIPANVERIKRFAFSNCSGFTGSLTIPNSVVQLGEYAFYKCSGFNGTLTISSNITELKAGTFGGCSNFTGDLIIPDSILVIEDSDSGRSDVYGGVFEGCSGFSGNLIIGENVESVGEAAFKNCSGFTGNLTIGNSVTSIGGNGDFDYGAFEGCSGFTGDLIIPDSVQSIEGRAFSGCSGFTGDLTIGNGVKSIGKFAFNGCSGFTGRLTIGGSVDGIESYTFQKCSGFTGDLIIPNSVTSIGDSAFEGCSGFTGSLTIPNSVTSIGDSAFEGCSGFTGGLTIPNSITSIEGLVFEGCSGFTGGLTIPNSITSIGDSAFEGCSGFTGKLIIGSNVKYIERCAFNGCSGFTGNLIIPDSVTRIGNDYPNSGCSDGWGYWGREEGAFRGCSGFTGNLAIGNRVEVIGCGTFAGCNGFTGSLVIPDSVISIGRYAFSGCSNFTGSLIIPDSVTSIERYAFEDCTGFTGSLTIPSSVTAIERGAFGPFASSKKVYWHCTLNNEYKSDCIDGGTVIYDDEVPEPTYLYNCIRIKQSDYEASEGDFPSDIEVPPDQAAIGAVDSATGRLIRSAYIILDGQTYRTDADGVYYFSLGQSSAVKRLVGATADGYLSANAVSMSVQHGRLTTVGMTKIVSDPEVGSDDVQVPAGKFAICVVDDSQKLIKNAAVEVDGDKIAVPGGVYYADADSASHYVSASAKGYGAYISVPITFNSGEKFSVFLRWNEDYNVTYTVGKVDSQDVFTQKICLDSWEYNTSNNFDFTKAASLLGKTAVLRMRDGMVMEIYALEECVAVSVSIVPDTSSFIYQDGRFSKDATDVHVSVHYMIKDGFPSTLLNGVQQKPKFEMNRIRLTIDEGMKVCVGKEEGNEFVSSESKILSVGETYSFDASVILKSKAKPIQPSPSYKMAVEASGPVHSAKGFQTFRVADADYKKEQTDKRPTTSGSDVSKASVAELLDANILFNIRGTVLEEQYFSEEQIQAVEKMLTLWVVNIDAATDTAREISGQEQFVMDVLNKLKVSIKPYVGVSDTTAQMRIIAETKNYGKRTFIFTLNLKNYRWDDKAPFARFGTVEWNVENPDGIPERFQHNICTMVTKASTDRFLNQLKDLAFDSIKNVYKKAWGNKANKVADMMIDKRILDVVNQEFGSVSDMCFKLMIQPTENYVKKGGRKKTTTRCPVDLYVYDSQGNIAGAIIDDIAYPMDDGVLVYVEDGAKIVDYYADEYTVKFVGNDTGTMSHEVCEYYSTGEVARQIDFKDIPLNDGKVYQETIPDFFFAPPEVYALEEESQEPIYPDMDSYDEERPEIILVEGISVTPETITLKVEEEKALEAVITPAEASLKLVEWFSDNENVVTVSEEGTVKAIGVGTAKVKVVSVDGRYEAECTVTVDTSGSENPDDPDNPDKPEDPEKPGQGDVLDEDMPQGGTNNIPKGLWISEVKPQNYTGKGIKPEVRVYDYKTLLQVKKDYTISYKNNIKANNAQTAKTAPTITVTGKGNYSGKETQAFQILQKDITDDDIIADDIVLKANKKMQKPVPVVSWDGKKLANKRDFSVSYTDTVSGAYKECGTYEIVLVGMGNYTGTRRIALTITEGKLASKLSVVKIPDQIYTGSEIKPVLTVKDGKTLLTEKVHYTVAYQNNVDAGTATVLLSGIGNYVGTKRVSFKIKAVASLKNASVFLSDAGGQKYAGGTYSGEEIKPDSYTLTVTVKGVDKKNIVLTLKEGVDYQVSYKNNIEAGNATIQFSGINGYTGNIKKIYKIKPYHFETDQVKDGKIKVALNQSYSYVKGGCKPKPVITFDGRELREKTDYTLSYKNNTKLNDGSNVSKIPTVTIAGKGNFRGKITDTYFINQADISVLALNAADKVWQNKGNIYKTKVVVKDIDNKVLSAGRDYDKNLVYTYHEDTQFADGTVKTAGTVISAKDTIPAGTIIGVTINAKGPNYYGAIYGTYRITKADIGKAVVKIPAQIYTGKAIKPDDEIEIKLNRQPLSKDNYEITGYSNNVNRGTATVTIRGKNDCGGAKTVKFTIKSKGFSWWWRK